MQHSDIDRAKICKSCDHVIFPQISPVILCLIWRDNEILLARAPHFNENLYSVIAGFVEPGENLEATVAREVKEEVGVDVHKVSYFASQPWPFPSNLMIAYTAEYVSGDVVIDKTEIADAKWFSLDKLPLLPPSISLSRRLIDSFVSSRRSS
jgi:NAD+ diphosphatase